MMQISNFEEILAAIETDIREAFPSVTAINTGPLQRILTEDDLPYAWIDLPSITFGSDAVRSVAASMLFTITLRQRVSASDVVVLKRVEAFNALAARLVNLPDYNDLANYGVGPEGGPAIQQVTMLEAIRDDRIWEGVYDLEVVFALTSYEELS